MRPGEIPRAVDEDGLFQCARAGDQAAWSDLVGVCTPKLIRVVRRRLNRPLRAVYDSYDFVGDVMKSLAANKDKLEFDSLEQLISFLAREAECKIIDEHRRAHTQKRNIKLRRSLHGVDENGEEQTIDVPGPDPTASQVALAGEVEAELMRGRSEPEKDAIKLKHQGYSPAEISHKLGWHPRKVQRFFKSLSDRFRPPPC